MLPFFLGRQLLRNSADIEEILRTLIIAGLLYSLPMLFEIRMSPQLHHWFYGYSPFGFATQMRYGGFRPSVFMENGLVAAFFVMTATVAATAFWRTRTRVQKLPPATITAYLSAILILCKSLGALIYGVVLGAFGPFSQAAATTSHRNDPCIYRCHLSIAPSRGPRPDQLHGRCGKFDKRGKSGLPSSSASTMNNSSWSGRLSASCSAGDDVDEVASTTNGGRISA